MISSLTFELDSSADNGQVEDADASAAAAALPLVTIFNAIDMSISPHNDSWDDWVAQHKELPAEFELLFQHKDGIRHNDSFTALAVALLNTTYDHIEYVQLEGGSRQPQLRVALRYPLNSSASAASDTSSGDTATVIKPLSEQVVIPLELRCRWWNQTKWQSSGCRTVLNNDGVACHCVHMTSFAVFLTGTDPNKEIDSAHAAALSAITYVGGSISIALLAATAVIYLVLSRRSWMEPSHLIVAHLSLALLGVHLCFLLAVSEVVEVKAAACQSMAVLLHYFLLTSFAWMLVEAFNLYRSFVNVMGGRKVGDHGTFGRVVALAWGLPALFVCGSLAFAHSSYGEGDYCWIDVESNLIYAFYVPVALMCAVNLYVLIRVAVTLQQNVAGRAAVKASFAFFWLMGLGWIFGLLLLVSRTLAFQYLFALFMALQGVFIFTMHCLRNQRVRKSFSSGGSRRSDGQMRHTYSSSGHYANGLPRSAMVEQNSAGYQWRRLGTRFTSLWSFAKGPGPRRKVRLDSDSGGELLSARSPRSSMPEGPQLQDSTLKAVGGKRFTLKLGSQNEGAASVRESPLVSRSAASASSKASRASSNHIPQERGHVATSGQPGVLAKLPSLASLGPAVAAAAALVTSRGSPSSWWPGTNSSMPLPVRQPPSSNLARSSSTMSIQSALNPNVVFYGDPALVGPKLSGLAVKPASSETSSATMAESSRPSVMEVAGRFAALPRGLSAVKEDEEDDVGQLNRQASLV